MGHNRFPEKPVFPGKMPILQGFPVVSIIPVCSIFTFPGCLILLHSRDLTPEKGAEKGQKQPGVMTAPGFFFSILFGHRFNLDCLDLAPAHAELGVEIFSLLI